MICSIGREIFGDLVLILPLEGNLIAAQDQQTLYTYLKWRDGQRGVGYIAYHVQNFSPPSLPEPKLEDSFQELPSWEVTHFAWLIAWGWRIHMREISPIRFQIPFLKGTSRYHFAILLSISPLHDDSLIADLHAEEEQCGGLIDEITSLYLEDIIIHGCYRERRRK